MAYVSSQTHFYPDLRAHVFTQYLYSCFVLLSTEIGEGIKDLAEASAGVNAYGTIVDGTVDVKPVTNIVEATAELADASAGVNAYGTNVDKKMGGKLEK